MRIPTPVTEEPCRLFLTLAYGLLTSLVVVAHMPYTCRTVLGVPQSNDLGTPNGGVQCTSVYDLGTQLRRTVYLSLRPRYTRDGDTVYLSLRPRYTPTWDTVYLSLRPRYTPYTVGPPMANTSVHRWPPLDHRRQHLRTLFGTVLHRRQTPPYTVWAFFILF